MSPVSAHADDSKRALDRRVHARHQVRSLAYVELGAGNGGIVLNVSEGGIAVQAVMHLMSDELPCVRVQLAHSREKIEAKGRISWTGGLRKTAGVEFVDLSQEARNLLREWVALESPSRETPQEATAPTATIEAAEPRQPAFEPTSIAAKPAELATNLVTKLVDAPPALEPALQHAPLSAAAHGLSPSSTISSAMPAAPVANARP